MPDGGELLLHRGGGPVSRLAFDPSRDVQRLDGGDRRHAMILAPEQEVRHRTRIGAARVRVAQGEGEEPQEAHASQRTRALFSPLLEVVKA